MSISIELSSEREEALRRRASAEGMDVATYLSSLIDQVLGEQRSFRAIAEPFAQAFRASGATEADLDAAIEDARQQHHLDTQSRGQ